MNNTDRLIILQATLEQDIKELNKILLEVQLFAEGDNELLDDIAILRIQFQGKVNSVNSNLASLISLANKESEDAREDILILETQFEQRIETLSQQLNNIISES